MVMDGFMDVTKEAAIKSLENTYLTIQKHRVEKLCLVQNAQTEFCRSLSSLSKAINDMDERSN